jgi:hypothetical protein
VQIASTVVLLVAAGLLVRSVLSGAVRDPGFDTAGAVTGRLDYRLQGYSEDRAREVARAGLRAVVDAPGIAHAALASAIPGLNDPVESVVLQTEKPQVASATVNIVSVSADFFAAIGMALQGGRSFTPDDVVGSEPVVIVSRAVAENLWPGVSPIGQHVRFQHGRLSSPPSRVVGIVGDTSTASSYSISGRLVFAPIEQQFPRRLALTIIARGPAPRDQLLRGVRDAVAFADRESLVYDLQTLGARVDRSLTGVRMMAEVLSAIGLLGLLVAVVGVYGVIAYLVSYRRRELCIMKALGSTDFALCRLVASDGIRMVLTGLLPGIGLAVAAGFALRRFLIGVPPYDWVTLTVVAAAVLATGLAACVLPAFNAIRGDTFTLLKES